jgi:hypothetical protein
VARGGRARRDGRYGRAGAGRGGARGRDDNVGPNATGGRTRIRTAATAGARGRPRSRCRFVLPLVHFIPGLLRDSVPLFLMRQCDRTLARARDRAGFPWCVLAVKSFTCSSLFFY